MRQLLLLTSLFLLAPFLSFSQVNLSQGLVAYYPFNGDANDHSGNNNNPIFNNATPSAGQGGLPNTAYYFNGQNAYMQIPNSPSLQIGNALTMFARICPRGYYYGTCHGNNILSKGTDDELNHFALRYDDAIYTSGQHCNGTPPDTLHENLDVYVAVYGTLYTPFIEKNDWYNIAITTDGVTTKAYVNCQLVATTYASAHPHTTTDDLFFGMLNNPAYPYYLNGDIDEIRLYNRVLNPQEVNALSGCPVTNCLPDISDFSLTPSFCTGTTMEYAAAFPDSITTATWNFGDGSTGNTVVADHTYAAPGNYMVTLDVVYNSGCKDTVSKVIPVQLPAIDTSVVRTKDTTLCIGDSLLLEGRPNGDIYCWTPTATLSNPTIQDPESKPTAKTTYFCTILYSGANLVYNGDFSSGNTGFLSDYYAVTPENSGVQYWVGNNPSGWDNAAGNCTDHTTGSGQMMMVSGGGQFSRIWTQQVTVQPQTNYVFSTWIESLSPAPSPVVLNFSVNGAILPGSITAPTGTCTWVPYSVVWNSGDSTTATLALVVPNLSSGGLFALDDISFAPDVLGYDSVTVNTATYPNLQVRADTTICGSYNVPLYATGAAFYSWSPGTGLRSDSTIANPIAPTAQTTAYVVTAYNYPSCISKDTVTATVDPVPTFSISVDYTELCRGASFSVTAQGGNTFQWDSSGQVVSTQGTYTGTAGVTDTLSVIQYDSTCLIYDTLHSIVRVDTFPILTVTKSNDIDCNTSEATLTASGGDNYAWNPIALLSSPSSAVTTTSPDTSTWYTVSSVNGVCTTVDSIEVNVSTAGAGANPKFVVPTAFTPNGDGINDYFTVSYWAKVEHFELSVYNRYGDRVYYTENIFDRWDGTYNGVLEPSGVYVYMIKATSACSASGYLFRKGTVTLIR